MSRKITINGLAHTTDAIAKEDLHTDIEINILREEVIVWDNETIFKKLPNTHGVYVIYDYLDKPVYVGKTWNTDGFMARFKDHRGHESGYFPYWQLVAKYVRLYHISKRLEMLTLERIKIQQHEPPFNKEDLDRNSGVADGEKKDIMKRLQDLVDKIQDFDIDPSFTERDIKLYVILSGYNKAEEMIKLEVSQTGALSVWLGELVDKYGKLPSYSRGYKAGMRELILGEDPY